MQLVLKCTVMINKSVFVTRGSVRPEKGQVINFEWGMIHSENPGM